MTVSSYGFLMSLLYGHLAHQVAAGETTALEVKLDTSLKDSGLVRSSGDLAKGR